eukprot:1315158-Heterocapsa_arctica.AAC.1
MFCLHSVLGGLTGRQCAMCQNNNPRNGLPKGSAISPNIVHIFLRGTELSILTDREGNFQEQIIELYNQECWIQNLS